MNYLLLIAMLFTSCSSMGPQIDASLVPYVTEFEKEYMTRVLYPVRYATIETPLVMAYCLNHGDEVVVDPYKTQGFNYYQMEALIFHELAHCSYSLEHYDQLLGVGHPASIMNSEIFNKSDALYYKDNRDYYVEELRKRMMMHKGMK